MMANEIVVGVDGSAASRTALRWAAAEASRTGRALRVLHAYHWRMPGAFATSAELERAADARARRIVDEAVAEARAVAPDATIAGEVVLGDPAPALLRAAETAGMVVVGNRSRFGLTGRLLGSVGLELLHDADCAVLIVRAPQPA